MNLLPLLFSVVVWAAVPQETSLARALIDLAKAGSEEAVMAQVRLHPDVAREALHDLMRESVHGGSGSPLGDGGVGGADSVLETAERLARAYFRAWTDPFLMQELDRFRSWSPADRRVKLLADSLRLLGNTAYQSDGIPQAMELWRESLGYSERLDDVSGIAKSQGNLGAGYYVAGEPDSAQVWLTVAYEKATEVGDFRTAASAVTNLANLAFDSGDLSRAAELYTQAIVILSRTGEHRHLSAAQHNLGLVSMDLGDLANAREALEQSVQLSRLHGYPEDEAEGLASLADVAQAEGEYQEATDLLDRALVLSTDTGNRVAEAGIKHGMGILNLARGDYRRAEDLLKEAVETFTELGHLPDAVDVRQDLARARVATGDLRGGLRDIQEARRLADSLFLGTLAAGNLALTAADIHLALREYSQASSLFQEAEVAFENGSNLVGLAAAVEGQGYLDLIRGDFQEATGLLARSIRLQTQAPDSDPRALSITRLYLASAEEEAGDVGRARRTLVEAGEALAAVGDRVGEAAVVATLGALEARAGSSRTADSLFSRGKQLLGDRAAPEVRWRLHAGQARVLEAWGRLDEAAFELHEAIRVVEGSLSYLPLEDKSRVRADHTSLYSELAGILIQLGETNLAFEVGEQARARGALAAMSGGRLSIPAGAPSDLLEREEDLRNRLRNLQLAVRGHSYRYTDLREVETERSLRSADLGAALADGQREYAQLLTEIKRVAPEYSSLMEPEPTSVEEVSSLLEFDEVLLEYLITDSNTFVFVLNADSAAVVPLGISGESLSEILEFAREVIQAAEQENLGRLWRAPMRRLYNALIRPLEEDGLLVGGQSLVIVPHRELHYLPFQALLHPEEGDFLVERFQISYAPSASTWLRIRNRFRGNEEIPLPGAALLKEEGSSVLVMAPRTGELPGSRYEAETVEELFGDRARLFLGNEASEATFRDWAPSSDIVHLATFGWLNKTNPLFSHIELAPMPGDPGVLEVHEIFGLRLRAHLLALSACETALGSGTLRDVPPGDEWVGLASAFLVAGADNVLASLWRVEDLATSDLMGRFYRYLASGNDVRAALAKAQRELLSTPDKDHPFYWAGFQLVGEGGGH